MFDLSAIDGLGVKLPVEIGQRTDVREARILDASFDGPLVTTIGLLIERFSRELSDTARQATAKTPPPELPKPPPADNSMETTVVPPMENTAWPRRERWQEKYEQLLQLQRENRSQRAIARELGLTHGAYRLRTIRTLLERKGQEQQQLEFLTEHPIIRPLSDYSLDSLLRFRKDRHDECQTG